MMIWLGDVHIEWGHPRTIGLAFALIAGAVIAVVGRLAPRKKRAATQPAALGMSF